MIAQTLERRAGWHPLSLDAMLAAWLTLIGNVPLWLAVGRLSGGFGSAHAWAAILGFSSLLFGLLLTTFQVMLWRPWRRVVGILLIATTGVTGYFMLAYGVVIDPTMMANVIHTDRNEVRGLLSWPFVLSVLLGVVAPGIWWWRARTAEVGWKRLLWQRSATIISTIVVCSLLASLTFQDLASLMRNNKSLRYMISPYNSIYALALQGVNEHARAVQPLHQVGLDATSSYELKTGEVAPLVVVVVGETVRAANFGLGGYARDTTPKLAALKRHGDLTYFSDVTSCGTNTQVSVPCMFSRLGRSGLDGPREEGLVDLLHRAGWSTFWVDNQSGCKGVCDRVPHKFAYELAPRGACNGPDCPDSVLPQLLPQLIHDTSKVAGKPNGTAIFFHQMGNHGPAYYQRSQVEHKHFLPECETNVLSSCNRQEIVNAYDNAIRATDQVLADFIEQLAQHNGPAALLYASDHGESLGENGLYLHGMPWSIAPSEQKHIPMLLWMSRSMRERLKTPRECLQQLADQPWSHDNFFHTVLGLAQVHTSALRPELNILGRCNHPLALAYGGSGK